MKKILSFAIAMAVSVSSFAAFAAPNRFGVEPEKTVAVNLDAKIKKSTQESYGDYATEDKAMYVSGASANIDAKAVIDMSEMAETFLDYVDKGAQYVDDYMGDMMTYDEARAAVIEYAVLNGVFTITVDADSDYRNESIKVIWDDTARTLFEKDSENYDSATNKYTLVMKIKATNAELDEYFKKVVAGEDDGVISAKINGTVLSGDYDVHGVESSFAGNITVEPPYGEGASDVMTVSFNETDTNYVELNRKNQGGGGPVTVPTAKPTEAPTEAPSEAPTEAPSEEPTEAPSEAPTEAPSEEPTEIPLAPIPTPPAEPEKGGTQQGAMLDYDTFAYIEGYNDEDVVEDGQLSYEGKLTIKPEADITRAEVATIFFRLLTADSKAKFASEVNDFNDVNEDDWFNIAVSTVANAGIVNGYGDGSFRPDNKITRAEFATIASRFTRVVYNGSPMFKDLSGHWAEDHINNVTATGWINGYEDNTFRPENRITRAEAIAIVNRILYKNVVDLGGENPYEDVDSDSWYYEDIRVATGHAWVQ